jgi:hypothetical protein
MRARRRLTLFVSAVALLASAVPAVATTAVKYGAPQVREYEAQVRSGSARFAHAYGAVFIRLLETQSGPAPEGVFAREGPSFAVSITLRGDRCTGPYRPHVSRRCLSLSGSLAGTAERIVTNPDLPSVIRLKSVSGHVSVLGSVTATGSYVGTGFILKARRGITLTLHGASGAITLHGVGPAVGAFQTA